MPIIVSETDEIRKIISQEVELNIRNVFREFGITNKSILSPIDQLEWLPIEQAKLIVPIKSKKKWKELRDTCQVHFTKAGKGFLYDRKSLIDYLNNNSTLKKSKRL